MIVWLKFIICALAIFLAGSRLTKYGDQLADQTGLCKAWLGLVLLAMVTSLPELSNAISAAYINMPDLAVGDIIGACLINVFFLALFDLWQRFKGNGSIFSGASSNNLLSAEFGTGILLITFLGLGLSKLGFDFVVFNFSIYTLAIFIFYLLIQQKLYRNRRAGQEKKTKEKLDYFLIIQFFLMAVVVVAAGSWLPFIGTEIVEVMGWGETFVAILFLGIATTLPELTVSFSALRLGEVGMCVGNFVGSNIFNVAILFIADLFFRQGSLLAASSPVLIYGALSAAVLLAMVYSALKKGGKSHLPTVLIIYLYLLSF